MRTKFPLLCLMTVTLGVGCCDGAETIALRTARPLEALSRKWAEAYMHDHPEARIQLQISTSEAAFEALERGQTPAVVVPRHIQYPEVRACIQALGKRPAEYKTGINGVAVYVNGKNPMQALTLDDLAELYTGRVANWKSLGGGDVPVVLYGTGEGTAAYETFKYEVLYRKEFTDKVHHAEARAIISAVGSDSGAIGFCPLTEAGEARALAVKRARSSTPVLPSEQTIRDRTYPIMQYFYIYVSPAADAGGVKNYIDWICSEKGQAIVKEAGYYSLPAELLGK